MMLALLGQLGNAGMSRVLTGYNDRTNNSGVERCGPEDKQLRRKVTEGNEVCEHSHIVHAVQWLRVEKLNTNSGGVTYFLS